LQELLVPPPSLARTFFEQITQTPDPVAFLRGLVNSDPPTVETDWLDFKTEDPDPKKRDRKIRETWSEAIGGFANNQGGVLVWGIDARPTNIRGVQVDAAKAEKPMTEPVALKSRLAELQRQATDPPLLNVEVRAYGLADDPGKGFVVCYVPEGAFKPYRSEQASQQWYIRAGDNFVVMSRSMLQAMFYPRSRAVFRVKAEMSLEFLDEGRRTVMTLKVWVTNQGTATAKDITLRLHDNLTPYRGEWTRSLGWELLGEVFWRQFSMHPGVSASEPVILVWTVPAAPLLSNQWSPIVPGCQGPEFQVTVYAEDQQPQDFEVKFGMDELVRERQITIEVPPREPSQE
jgi:hypothetical protein